MLEHHRAGLLPVWLRLLEPQPVNRHQDVDELLAKFPFRSQQYDPVTLPYVGNPATLAAIRKMHDYRARTGHKLTDLLYRK
jgi:hypothetical protein